MNDKIYVYQKNNFRNGYWIEDTQENRDKLYYSKDKDWVDEIIYEEIINNHNGNYEEWEAQN